MKNCKRIIATASILLSLLGLCSCGKSSEELPKAEAGEVIVDENVTVMEPEADLPNNEVLDEQAPETQVPDVQNSTPQQPETQTPDTQTPNEPNSAPQAPVTQPETQTPSTQTPAGEKYESDDLTPINGSVLLKGKLSGVQDAKAKYLVGKDGTLYFAANGIRRFEENADVAKVIPFNKTDIAYLDSKGYYHIAIENKEYIGTNIKGTLVGGFGGMLGGCYVVSVDAQGYLYLNDLTSDGIKKEYDNEKLYIYDKNDKTFHEQVKSIELFYDDSGNCMVYAKTKDRTFYAYVHGFENFQGKRQFFISGTSDFGRVWDYGYSPFYGNSPIYSKTDSDTSLYYRHGEAEYPLDLPKGYQAKDIKQVLFGNTTVVRMKDNTVYAAILNHTVISPSFQKIDALSNNHVQSLYRNNNQFYAWMDDQVLYLCKIPTK